MDLKTRYVVKGIGKEQTIASVIQIFTTEDGSKITKVEDKWDGKLPESSFVDVSFSRALSPIWWMNYWIGWLFWLWSFVWYTRAWLVSFTIERMRMLTIEFCVDLPEVELGHCAQDYQCAEERGGGCEAREPSGLNSCRFSIVLV